MLNLHHLDCFGRRYAIATKEFKTPIRIQLSVGAQVSRSTLFVIRLIGLVEGYRVKVRPDPHLHRVLIIAPR